MARGRVREPRGGGGVPGGPRAAIPPALGFLARPMAIPWSPPGPPGNPPNSPAWHATLTVFWL